MITFIIFGVFNGSGINKTDYNDQKDIGGRVVSNFGSFLVPKKIQTILKYDRFDTKNIQGDQIEMVTFGLNWFFSKKTKFQINYEYQKEESRKISNNLILAQIQVGF